ncbi:mechanosensitive ion channel family protein [Stigmatella erecta]|uniref:Small-conductance mechanosensitive channel n=1 Tax=Stigmatella erecta TaxID=83460 RepID=A0A1I0D4Y4_9BACT|nr:mechanosensitive ion channel family protein [Stigmatella erecta]SET27209.1 Small-conductance mechanosensitive channel [Stigmatella erecta]
MSRAFLAICAALLASSPAWALNAGLGAPPPTVDRLTPQATVKGFLAEAHAGNYAVAAHYLDLDYLPRDKQAAAGAQLARRLKFVLDRKLPVDLSLLSAEPEGDPKEARFDQMGSIALEGAEVPIRVQRVVDNGGALVWVFNESTVKEVDRLFGAYGPVLTEVLPDFFFKRTVLGLEAWQWLGLLVVLVGGWALSLLLERLTLGFTQRLAKWTKFTWDDALVGAGRGPLRLPYFALLLAVGTSLLLLPQPVQTVFARLSYSLTIIALAWFILRFLGVSSAYVQERVASKNPDNGDRIRGLNTQLTVMRHVLEVATYVIAAALLLMQFEVVRNVGVSLLASAGIAGLVIGLAAQKSISTLLAGIQLSITQPIRMGDQVVVEGEFGTIEEISLTYVVVRIWDNRRLVIPITQFLDKPFQNWSRSHSEMLGEVILQVDYSCDIDVLRAELKRILENEGRELWDGKVQTVVVLNVLDKTLSVRALVSAPASKLFDLRCLVRERLVVFLRGRPGWLPTVRSETRPVTVVTESASPEQGPAPRA